MTSMNWFVDRVLNSVRAHRLAPGQYSRWLWQNEDGTRNLAASEYGCADAANILYTFGRFPADPVERAESVRVLQSMQDPETGLFHEPTHYAEHSTAHCSAALELFEAKPLYPLSALQKWNSPEGVRKCLDALVWNEDPWDEAHKGAGAYAALKITGEMDAATENAYFDWLYENTDPDWGMSRRGSIDGTRPNEHHLYGWFHYLFNFEYAHRPQKYPERLIDSCIKLYREHQLSEEVGHMIGFAEVDWIYSLNRATRQTAYRFDDAKQALRDFADEYVDYLKNMDYEHDEWFNDLHALFGTVCAVAELQSALPGEFFTDIPLRLVLDRRPFI